MRIKVNRRRIPIRVDNQPIPIKDYINFKNMSGNEIILNLDNCENLRNGELISGLYELSKRDKDHQFDWNAHPVTVKCIAMLKKRMNGLNAKNVI